MERSTLERPMRTLRPSLRAPSASSVRADATATFLIAKWGERAVVLVRRATEGAAGPSYVREVVEVIEVLARSLCYNQRRKGRGI